MTGPELHVLVPGPLDQRTGGYLYDARMVTGLRRLGWRVEVHNLEGAFPRGDELACGELAGVLVSIADDARVLIDGLAMGGIPEPIREHSERLRIISLVHHPLADETGLSPAEQQDFVDSEQEALGYCMGVIVTSAYTARRLEAYGVPGYRVRVVVPGTEPARPAEGPGDGAPPRLLCVATVTPRKGHDVLVSALRRVRDLEWTCVCAGALDRDRDFAEKVLSLVREVGLSDRVEFVGEHDASALDQLYHESSLFVLASYYEGYGMALTEALARGLPVVSTTGGAIPFTVPDDASVLVPPGEDLAFAEALRALLSNGATSANGAASGPERREALAAAALRHAERLPDWDRAAASFAKALVDLAPDLGPGAVRTSERERGRG